MLELAQFPVTARGRSGVRKADPPERISARSLDFLLLLQRVVCRQRMVHVVSSEQELVICLHGRGNEVCTSFLALFPTMQGQMSEPSRQYVKQHLQHFNSLSIGACTVQMYILFCWF